MSGVLISDNFPLSEPIPLGQASPFQLTATWNAACLAPTANWTPAGRPVVDRLQSTEILLWGRPLYPEGGHVRYS
jgi:hypothetical protein